MVRREILKGKRWTDDRSITSYAGAFDLWEEA